jgi:hypothetical protein
MNAIAEGGLKENFLNECRRISAEKDVRLGKKYW